MTDIADPHRSSRNGGNEPLRASSKIRWMTDGSSGAFSTRNGNSSRTMIPRPSLPLARARKASSHEARARGAPRPEAAAIVVPRDASAPAFSSSRAWWYSPPTSAVSARRR